MSRVISRGASETFDGFREFTIDNDDLGRSSWILHVDDDDDDDVFSVVPATIIRQPVVFVAGISNLQCALISFSYGMY